MEKSIEIKGTPAHGNELSGLARWGDLLIACPDEGAEFNVLKPAGADAFVVLSTVNLLGGGKEEIDMEGAASDGQYVYVVGSHSIRRKAVSEKAPHEKNLARLTNVSPHEESYHLFRFKLDEAGQLTAVDDVSLLPILKSNDVLGSYVSVPGKENGIDIEGVAVKNGRVYVGFRGPVIRGNFVPVLSFAFERPEDYTLRFVQLAGRGIRDLAAVEDGFLVLAGPVGEGDSSYQLYLWNGEDCVPDKGVAKGKLTPIGDVATVAATKPEGLAVMAETPAAWRLLVLSDGAEQATQWLAAKP